jgi:hypothetical protein
VQLIDHPALDFLPGRLVVRIFVAAFGLEVLPPLVELFVWQQDGLLTLPLLLGDRFRLRLSVKRRFTPDYLVVVPGA